MSGPGEEPQPAYRPSDEGHHHLAGGRAFLLIVAAIVLVIAMFHVTGGAGPPTTKSKSPRAHTTGRDGGLTSSTTAATTVPPSASVKVLVANGSTVGGAASTVTTTLKGLGWTLLTAKTAKTKGLATSTVYYKTGKVTDATTVANELKIAAGNVKPLTQTTPVTGSTTATVVVILGTDVASAPHTSK